MKKHRTACHSPLAPRLKNEQGIALLLVLLILSLLVALILEFDAEARREYREAAVFRNSLAAGTLARSGVQAARAVLRQDARADARIQRPYDGPTEVWAMPVAGYQLGDGTVSAVIEDEKAKFNLNDLVAQPDAKSREVRISRLKRLFELLRLDPRLVDGIADWTDADDAPEPNGAETAYYQALTPPYRAANGPFNTLAELRLVKGFSGELVATLSRYLTVYPQKADGLINLNTADPVVIQALDPRITPSLAQAVVQARPLKSVQDLDRVSGLENIGKELRMTSTYTVRSDHFSTLVTARVGDVGRSVRAVIQRSNGTGETSLLLLRFEE